MFEMADNLDLPPAALALRRLREHAGLGLRELAKSIGKASSSYADYERIYKKTYQPVELMKAVLPHVVGRGNPPITEADVMAIAGLSEDIMREARPTAIPGDLTMVPSFDGIAEMNVIGGLGTGGSAIAEAYTSEGNSVSADEVRDMWNLPPSYISGELRLTSKRARIIEVRGDSMEPTLYSGDRVMIDVADRGLAQEGIFALWDGDGVSVKRVERVRPSDPPALRVISDNARHREVELLAEEVQIIGRVVWVARKM